MQSARPKRPSRRVAAVACSLLPVVVRAHMLVALVSSDLSEDRHQSKPRAPPCLRQGGLCSARAGGDRLARRTGGYCIAEWRHIAQSFHGWWFVEVSRATVPTSESESWLGGCHVQPHLPQDVSLYFTWEMILRCRCKRSIRFVQEQRDSEKTRGGADLDSALCCQSKPGRSPSKVHGTLLLYSQQK